MDKNRQRMRLILRAIKLAVGSSIAIYIAQLLHLQFEASAGSIAFLTILTTKWETVKLSLVRVITFVISVFLAWLMFTHMESEWVAFGIFVLSVTILCEVLGWKAAVSVNIVIGTHFFNTEHFTREFIWNEFMLVLIGITIALLLNLYHGNGSQKKEIICYMRDTEAKLQSILGELAAYLLENPSGRNVWDDIINLEKQLQEYLHEAYEYQNNTFQSHQVYYIEYFEMRSNQCTALHNLHFELKRIRNMPGQAKIVAGYILYMKEYVVEMNVPAKQLEALQQIFLDMKEEPLPVTREEFESRALLYHILMDLEEFLMFKKRFVEGLDGKTLERYWKKSLEKREKGEKRI